MMSGFTMNYLNSLRMHVFNHVTPMAAVCDQPLLSECASYIHEQCGECGEICKWHAVIFAFILVTQLLVCRHCY